MLIVETPLWTVQKNFLSQSGCLKTFLIVSGCLKTAQNCFCWKTEDWRGSLLHKLKESWSTASRCVLFQVARTYDDEQWCIPRSSYTFQSICKKLRPSFFHHITFFLQNLDNIWFDLLSLSRSQGKHISTHRLKMTWENTQWKKMVHSSFKDDLGLGFCNFSLSRLVFVFYPDWSGWGKTVAWNTDLWGQAVKSWKGLQDIWGCLDFT